MIKQFETLNYYIQDGTRCVFDYEYDCVECGECEND